MPRIRKNNLINLIRENRHTKIIAKKIHGKYYLLVYDKDNVLWILNKTKTEVKTFPDQRTILSWIERQFGTIDVAIE